MREFVPIYIWIGVGSVLGLAVFVGFVLGHVF